MAINSYIIPLSNVPETFGINLAGVNYSLTVKWNNADEGGWVLDIGDEANNPIACNLPLITGVNVLAGLNYLGINGELIVYTNGDSSAVPTLENLGSDSNLYFQTSAADNGG
jgi:hypothetical protein